MSVALLVKAMPGVRNCIVGDSDGIILEQHGAQADGKRTVGIVAAIQRDLTALSSLLNIGTADLVTTKGTTASWVIAYRGDASVAVKTEPNQALTKIEAALQSKDWQISTERVLSDSDIEYVRSEMPTLLQSTEAVVEAPKPPPLRQALRASDTGDIGDLRRALIRGQIAIAEKLAVTLCDASGASLASSLRPLLEGIACILAGDAFGGLMTFELVEENTNVSPSLKWVLQIWRARASISSGAELSIASAHASIAASLAAQLDSEARAISTLVQAEVALQQREFEQALELCQAARLEFEKLRDDQELSSCWLLEARVLGRIGSARESLDAAKAANLCRPSWPAPVTFITMRALESGELEDAERAIASLLSVMPQPAEIARDKSLLEAVQNGVLPAFAAYEYLDLVEAAPGRATIRQLERLCEAYPRFERFREAFGWKLLQAGDYESAGVVFDRLSLRADLPDDVRSSVLLALGCLAAVEARNAKPGVKLWAAVRAAPKHLQSETPGLPSALNSTRATPADFLSTVPPVAAGDKLKWEQGQDSPRRVAGGPVFAGNLQLFALPELLAFLNSGQRTGTLVCSSVAGIGAIQMCSGKITGAVSPSTRRLEDYLLEQHVVNKDQLRMAEAIQQSMHPTPMIGSVLAEEGMATVEQVRGALLTQLRDAMGELFRWGEGRFAFDPENAIEFVTSDVDIEVDPQALAGLFSPTGASAMQGGA